MQTFMGSAVYFIRFIEVTVIIIVNCSESLNEFQCRSMSELCVCYRRRAASSCGTHDYRLGDSPPFSQLHGFTVENSLVF